MDIIIGKKKSNGAAAPVGTHSDAVQVQVNGVKRNLSDVLDDQAYQGFAFGIDIAGLNATAREIYVTNFVLRKNAVAGVFFNFPVPANATLTVKSTISLPGDSERMTNFGPYPMKYQGAAIEAGVLAGNESAIMVFDGAAWNIVAITNRVASGQIKILQDLIDADTDGVINKFQEIVNFLANIADTQTLEGIIAGINQSISNEATARQNADTSLQNAINTEATARSNKDTALENAISAEATARANADAALQTDINAKYTKPQGGIPKNDLADEVNALLAYHVDVEADINFNCDRDGEVVVDGRKHVYSWEGYPVEARMTKVANNTDASINDEVIVFGKCEAENGLPKKFHVFRRDNSILIPAGFRYSRLTNSGGVDWDGLNSVINGLDLQSLWKDQREYAINLGHAAIYLVDAGVINIDATGCGLWAGSVEALLAAVETGKGKVASEAFSSQGEAYPPALRGDYNAISGEATAVKVMDSITDPGGTAHEYVIKVVLTMEVDNLKKGTIGETYILKIIFELTIGNFSSGSATLEKVANDADVISLKETVTDITSVTF